MCRPITFSRQKPTSSSCSSSSTGEVRNLLSVLYEAGFCFIFKRKLLRKGIAVGGSRSDDLAVLDLSRVSDEGVVKEKRRAGHQGMPRRSWTSPSSVRSCKRAILERSFNGRYPIHQVRHFCYVFDVFISYV